MGIQMNVVCPSCGFANPTGNRMCISCHALLPAPSNANAVILVARLASAAVTTIIFVGIGVFYLSLLRISIPSHIAVAPSSLPVVAGPAFDEVISHIIGATDVQVATYFNTVKGTTVVWTGSVTQVTYTQDGGIVIQMTGGTSGNGINAYLDGTQNNLAPTINRGQQVAIQGVLSGWTTDVWRGACCEVTQAHIQ